MRSSVGRRAVALRYYAPRLQQPWWRSGPLYACGSVILAAEAPAGGQMRHKHSQESRGPTSPRRDLSDAVKRLLSILWPGGTTALSAKSALFQDVDTSAQEATPVNSRAAALDALLKISRAHDERAREALDAEIQQSGPNLLNLYEAKWRFFYGDNVATALREHAKFFYISHSVAGELQECALDDQRFSRLLELTALKIHDCRIDSTDSIGDSLVRLEVPLTHPVWRPWIAKVQAEIPNMSGAQAASIVWHVGNTLAGIGDGARRREAIFLLGRLGGLVADAEDFKKISIPSLSRMAWVLAQNQVPCSVFFSRFVGWIRHTRNMKQITGDTAWRVAATLALRQVKEDEVWNTMQRYLMPFINNYPSEAALARRNHASVDRIMKKIASRFLGGVMEPMRVGDMCIILGAFAEPGAEPPADRLEAWLRVVSKRLDMDAASNSDLRCLALILNQLNSMESVTAQAISTQVQRRLGELTDTELICFLDALAQARFTSDELLAAVTRHYEGRDEMPVSARDWIDLLFVYARMDIAPGHLLTEPWRDRARVQLAASAQTGSPLELEYCAKLAWSLAALQCLDPQLLSLAAESLKDGQRPDDALHAWKHMLAQADLSLRLEAQKTTDTGSNVRVSLLDARLHKECAVALGAGHSAMPEDVAQVAKEVQGVLEYLKLGFAPAVRLPEYYVLDFANAGRRIAVQIFDEAEFSIDARKAPLGRAVLTMRHLRALGWKVVPITVHLWRQLKTEGDKITYLSVKMAL